MSITSVHMPTPVSPHLDRMMGGEPRRLLLSPGKKQGININRNLRVQVAAAGSPVLGTNKKGHASEVEPSIETLVTEPLPPKSVIERAKAATAILNRYRIEYKNDWDIPQSVQYAEGQIQRALEKGVPIELVIPAFPFKSSNRSKKVLGPFPDEAERLSLLHLNSLCLAIQDAAKSETFLIIVSDGITYNDILGVSDQEVWRYGEQLRRLAKQNGCHNIRFARICDLISGTDTEHHQSQKLTEALYLTKASEYRGLLVAMTPPDFNVLEAIANDPDIAKTYKGYKKFLMSERDDRPNRSRSQTERENSAIAKSMILRGKAFAEAVRIKYPDSIRLSIHPSNDTNKVSITMLPQDNEVVMTPWHGAVVRGADGRVSMTHAILIPAMTHEIVYEDDLEGRRRPSYFRERSEVFDWKGMDVTFEYMYPCGVIIRPAAKKKHQGSGEAYPLSMVDMQKVRALALACSPVVLRGFCKDAEDDNYSVEINNLLYDLEEDIAENGEMGQRQQHEDTTRFQLLTTQPAGDDGSNISSSSSSLSLFASSDLLARYLPQAYNIKKLEKIKWSYHRSRCSRGIINPPPHHHPPPPHVRSCGDSKSISLVATHPIKNTPCIRWPQSRLQEPQRQLQQPPDRQRRGRQQSELESNCRGEEEMNITIENGTQNLVPLIDGLLLDRRVCLRFDWKEGDVLVVDELSMLISGPETGTTRIGAETT